jgi:alkyldihydroxyacetonephosphate synthase
VRAGLGSIDAQRSDMTAAIVDELRRRIGADRVETEVSDAHRHDQWVISILRALEQRAARPACVVRPRATAEVAAILELAEQQHVPVVPYGAGSGVCGGAVGPEGALVVDLRAMNRIVALNEVALSVTAQPGVMGAELERWLRERGYTMGHFPQSIDISSVGGWVSTRSSGQFSTKYGNIEDMLLAFEAVLPGGRVVRTRPVPRSACGPDLRALFLGSEGTLGILTEATLRVHPKPEASDQRALAFADVHAGLEAIREIVRVGWKPAVVRLYDAVEAARNFTGAAPDGAALLLFFTEGPKALVDAESQAALEICRRHGAEDRGTSPVTQWLDHRNRVPSFESFLERGIVVDTIEVATAWDRIHDLYEGVVGALRAIDGVLVASAHSSHSYTQGTNLYFSFAARPESMRDAEALYFRCWQAAMEATLAAAGTISHHHGIGRLRAGWMRRELGSAYELLVALKRALDPHGIMNPGALLDSAAASGKA